MVIVVCSSVTSLKVNIIFTIFNERLKVNIVFIMFNEIIKGT